MTRSERRSIITYAAKLTDEELEKEYYEAVMDSLGSDAERMYEMGYDLQDVLAQEELEKFRCQRADLLEEICEQRGIALWK